MRSFEAAPNTTGESEINIMFGRELNLPDVIVFGNGIEELKLHTDFAVDHQALLKDVHERV